MLADITHGNPRLVAHCRGFGKVYAMDVFQGLMAASDHHGNVMLIIIIIIMFIFSYKYIVSFKLVFQG